RTSTKQRPITLVVRSLRHRCRGKAKNDSNSGQSCSSVAPPRRTAAASGRRSCEKRFRLCPALSPDKWPALRSSLPHGLTSALSPGCCASYAPNNADVVPADTPSESPPPTRTAIRDDQRQVLAFQPAAIQILEQAFPVGLTLSLTAQKRQQVTPAIAPHAVSHQHLY